MSEENTQKLRLKPRLGGDAPATSATTPTPAADASDSSPVPAADAPSEKAAAPRLKPRMGAAEVAAPEKPEESARSLPAETPAPDEANPVLPEVPPSAPTGIETRPAVKFPPPGAKAPPPGAGGLPPPPNVVVVPIEEADGVAPTGTSKSKKILLAALGGAVVAGGATFIALTFFGDEPPPAPPVRAANVSAVKKADPTPKVEAPRGPITASKEILAKANTAHVEPTAEVVDAAAASAPSSKAGDAAVTNAVVDDSVAAAPVAPTAAAQPSAAFRAWVHTLKISGVRGGANPKVFIERTAYGPGDLVNPPLGIVFESYNADTRVLVFRDKSGAVVERKN